MCFLTMDNKRENVNKKVGFAEDVRKSEEAGMMCTVNGVALFLLTNNTWIRDSGASCNITNDNTSLFDIIDINQLIQGNSGNMSVMKKGKLCVNVQQVDGTEWVHTIWPVKICPKADENLFSLTCELL